MRNLLFLGQLPNREGDREGDGYGDLCLLCARYPATLQMAIDAL